MNNNNNKIYVVNTIPKKLLLPRYVEMLLSLKSNGDINQQELSFLTMTTYSHIQKIISMLKENNFVTMEKVGRTNIINLTKKGHEVTEHFIKVLKCFNIKIKGKILK